jgi:hypothetical protein
MLLPVVHLLEEELEATCKLLHLDNPADLRFTGSKAVDPGVAPVSPSPLLFLCSALYETLFSHPCEAAAARYMYRFKLTSTGPT